MRIKCLAQGRNCHCLQIRTGDLTIESLWSYLLSNKSSSNITQRTLALIQAWYDDSWDLISTCMWQNWWLCNEKPETVFVFTHLILDLSTGTNIMWELQFSVQRTIKQTSKSYKLLRKDEAPNAMLISVICFITTKQTLSIIKLLNHHSWTRCRVWGIKEETLIDHLNQISRQSVIQYWNQSR